MEWFNSAYHLEKSSFYDPLTSQDLRSSDNPLLTQKSPFLSQLSPHLSSEDVLEYSTALPTKTAENHYKSIVEQLEARTQEIFHHSLHIPDVLTGLTEIFGQTGLSHVSDTLLNQWSQGDNFPIVEIVDLDSINAKGAYSSVNKTIYLDESLFDSRQHQLFSTYLEELGHYMDDTINNTDTSGDEGEAFAALLLNRSLSLSEITRIQQENDLTIWSYQGQELIVECASLTGTEEIKLMSHLGEVLKIPGKETATVNVVFKGLEREAAYQNEIGVFVVDSQGNVNGVTPQEQGYAQAVFQSDQRQVLLSPEETAGGFRELSFSGGDYIAFYLIQNSSYEDFLKQNNKNQFHEFIPPSEGQESPQQKEIPHAFFSITDANPDGFDHIYSEDLEGGIWRLSWEDLSKGGDKDFNDTIFNVEQMGIILGGNEDESVPLSVEWLSKEASYSHELGYFLVDDPNGRIGNLLPGDSGYLQAVFNSGNYQTVFGLGESNTNKNFLLPSGKYLGWYLITNGTTTDFLSQNPTNQLNESLPIAYFSYSKANPDGKHHVYHNSPQEIVWEDLPNAGDGDYNDLVIRFELGTPISHPKPKLPQISMTTSSVLEGNEKGNQAEFIVSLSEASNSSISVNYQTINGTAIEGEDFEGISGQLTFAPGETEKRIKVNILGDLITEEDEKFGLKLDNVVNAIITMGIVETTIIDDDDIPIITLREGNNFKVIHEESIIIPDTPSKLRFTYTSLNFDQTTTNFINDAFEAALLDKEGNSLVYTLDPDKDAFFNLSEEQEIAAAHGVTVEGNTVTLDMGYLPSNTEANLVFRLVNNDRDTETNVRISDLKIVPNNDSNPLEGVIPQIAQSSVFSAIDLTLLEEVTSSSNIIYKRTSFNEQEKILNVDLALENKGTYSFDENLVLVVGNLSDNSVQILQSDGLTSEGNHYFDLSHLMVNGKLEYGEKTNLKTLKFLNPNQVQFTYDLTVLSGLNKNPQIESRPNLEIIGGQEYSYDVDATDPNFDPLTYQLTVAPDGMTINSDTGIINWQTEIKDIGNHQVIVEVTDGRGGITQQSYTLGVITAPPNRPPLFTSTPIVEAHLNQLYQYDANARDADLDPLTYSLITAPIGFVIDKNTGIITGTPTDLGEQEISLQVDDGKGGVAIQKYKILVQPERGNYAPVIITDPVTKVYPVSNINDPQLLDLSKWTIVQYDLTVQDPDASWQIQTGNTVVEQKINADASILLSNTDITNNRIEGTWRVGTSDDDDYIGFVFGYQDPQHFYLFDWKQADQNEPSLGFAERGMSIKVIDTNSSLTGTDLWPTNGNGQRVKQLFHNTVAWKDLTDYKFTLDFLPGQFTITVKEGNTILESVTINDNTYTSGKFGFYNYSQSNVLYSGFTQQTLQTYNYAYDVDAIDPDQDKLTYSLSNKPTGMTINSDTGLITWTATSQSNPINVEVKVEDGRGGFDTQSFIIELANRNVDLTLANIQTENLVIDGQLLTVSGQVSAQIKNQGLNDLSDPFKVVFFEDRNINQAYDVGIDTVLGEAQVNTPLQAGQSTTVTTNLSGFLSFVNSPIWGFVDAEKVITETNENNNLAFSSQDCIIQPAGQFNPVVEWNKNTFSVLPSSNQVMMTPAVIDLNGDKIPDIVFSTFTGGQYVTDGKLRAISGANGSELWTVTNPAYEVRGAAGVAVGDIDNDGKPEILATAESGDALIAFEHDGTFKWRSPAVWGGINWGSASIADLNQDGTPEIIIGATALDNQGRILWQGNSVGGLGRGDNGVGPLSVVADLDLDGSPEVIAGRSAYRANGSLYWNASIGDGFPAIGNFDSDPNPEIVVVSSGQVYLLEHTGQIKWGGISIPGGGRGGAPTIADVDGDGQPEIGVAGASRYVVFETDGSIKWTSVTQDNSSNVTGSSVFDFDGDGKAEIVYGDEVYLRIYNGSDGKILYQLPKSSATTYELPLIVDVDADGNAEIVAIANNSFFGQQTGIFVIGDLNDTWVSTRQIWNQHSYHITNINDDGSIPITEQNSWQSHNTYRLNLQTNYSPLAAPDLTASYLRTEEASGKTTIKARIGNGGSIFVASGVNIAFYKGDPKAGGVLLGTTKTTKKLEIGAFEDVSLTVNETSLKNIWVVADDDGTGKGRVNECNEENNRYSEVFVNGRGEIRGIKWHDLDEDGILNDEPGLANVIVYLDLNNNGLLDSNEPSQITTKDNPNTLDIDETGQYRFTNLSTGTYIVREIVPDQWKQTYPNNPNPFYTVAVAQGEIVNGINFGNVEKNSSRKTFIFTKDADWNLGVLTNINYQTPNNNQLQLDPNIETIFNHIWVSLSGRDAVAKINTDYNDLDDGRVDNNNFTAVLGEYLTRPNGMQGNPSRTTVDRNGDVWVGNRNENGLLPNVNGVLISNGSVTKISANVTGSNTSTGVWNATTGTQGTFDRRAWSNTGGVDTNGGTDTASDSAILQYVRLPNAEAVRHVSVDANNNVWVGGYPFATRNFYLLDGDNGQILDSFNASNFGAGGYGGLIDSNGVLWSASLSQNALLRYDPVTRVGKKIAVPNSYGLGIDSNGFIWNTDANNNKIYKIDPSGNIVGVFATGGGVSTGVAVTLKDNHIWIANRSSNTITRLDNNGRLLASISVGRTPTGLSVDSNGKVWVTNFDSDNVMRIDPATNKVDLTIYLGSNADPYNYSDMTGSVLTGITIPTGIWRTVVDGEQEQRQWGVLRWNTEAEALIPQGASIKVEVRVADTVIGLDNQMWQAYDSGEILNLAGRYAEIRATLTKGTGINQISPILSDIRLSTAEADIPNIAPVITSLPSEQIAPNRTYKYQIQASDADNDKLTYSLLKLPNGMTLDRNLLTWTPTLDQLGEHPIEIKVTDGKGGEAIQRFIITVTPSLNNQAPVITSIAPNTAYIDDLLRYNVKATDAEGDRLTFELLLKPQGMAIDPTTGVLIWTPTLSQIGLHDVILRVKDNQDAITLQSFQLNVPNFNNVPIITSNPDLEAIANLPYQYQIEAQDSDGDSLSYRLENAPNGMTINTDTGLLNWTANNSQIGQIPVTIIVKDSQGAETRQTYTLNVVATAPNNSPQITSTPRNSLTLGTSYFYALNTSDPDGDPLTINLQIAPTGMILNQQGVITWTPEANQLGNHTVKVQVNDGRGGLVEQEWEIAVVSQRSSNQAPQILSTPALKANINQVYQYNLVGNDPDGDPIFWSLETRPQGMSLDVTKGTIRWEPKLDQIGLHEVVIQGIDTQGATSSQRFTLAVNGVNLPPNIISSPLTQTVTNQLYTYTVVAQDPENGVLTYNLGRKPNNMTLDATGNIQWTPTQAGTYDIDVLVTDNQGATVTQTYQLVVGTQTINQAPNITSTPLFVANVGNPYQYQIQATDPDGQALTYQLLQAPQGMTINANTGLVQWESMTTGNYRIVVAAFDSLGLGVTQSYTLTAKINSLPIIRSTTPPTGGIPGVSYRYDIQASDPDGGILKYSIDSVSQAKGITVDEKGRLSWTPTSSQMGTHAITITITDAAQGQVTQSFNLIVAPDTTAPKVTINPSKNFTNKNESVSFQVSATDNVGIANLQLLINDTPVIVDSNGVATFTPTNPGVITAKAQVSDAAGNKAETTTTVNVLDPTDTEAPTVSLDLSGIANYEITSPTPIKGTINDSNLAYYALEVAPADGSAPFKEMFRGTTTVTDGVLGILDPTLLPNDSYKVRLIAYDVNGKGNGVTELLDVKGDLKLGNFQLSFTDLEISTSGIPITLTRTYDSLYSNNKDDFGYGWRMEFRDADIRTSLPKDELYEELGFRSVGFKEGDAIYITLPGGKREKFTFKLKEIYVMGYPLSAFMGRRALYRASFVPDKGVTSTLKVDEESIVLIRGENGQIVPFSGGSAFAHYHPQDWGNYYQLTTKEGIVYDIDATTGDINSITNRNGDKLTLTDAGITSSNGQNITFRRDTKGRIVSVTDAMGKQIKYEYDSQGDLIKVTDRDNNTTQFKYNNAQPHYLDEIIDPLGRTGIKNEYDDNGRLTKVFNGEGQAVQLEYNPDNFVYSVKDPLGNSTTYESDARGNIITEIDANGGIIKRTYDDNNNLLSETNPEGEKTTYTYDSKGNKLSETDALGNITRYTYNSKNDILTTTDALGNVTTNTYDSRGNLLSISGLSNGTITLNYNNNGLLTQLTTGEGITKYEYDFRGNITKEINPLGHEITYTYDGNNNRLTETRKLTTANGIRTLVTKTEYDAKGNIIKVTDAEGNVTQTIYDAAGQKIQEIDALGRITKYVYSDSGQLLETIYPDSTPNNDTDNPRTRKEYDAANQVIADIDELGRITRYQYDGLGRLIYTIYPDLTPNDNTDNPRKETRYDKAGRIIAEVDERGNITRYTYDDAGRRTETILPDNTPNNDSDNPKIIVTYDANGRQISQTDPLGHKTQYLYDNLGRPTGQIFADNTSISTTFDLAGRVIAKIDQEGNKTQYEYNALGQLTAVIDALNHRTEYGYDELGNLITQKDANGNITRYEYDGIGRRIATQLPLNQRSSTQYDKVGNIINTTDFNGQIITFTYDERNRLIKKTLPNNNQVTYTYTLTGQRATETDSNGTITYQYDSRDRLLSRIDSDGVKIEYTYDAAGNRTSVNIPSGKTSYTFDEQNRLKTVTDPNNGVTTYTYDLAGNLIKTTLPNGTIETREYDLLNRLLYLENRNSNGIVNSFRYTLDKVGNRLTIVEEDGRKSNYEYDDLYRLLKEEIIDGTTRIISYTYDPVSNRLTRNDSVEGNTNYEYDNNDRLLKEVTNGVTTTYTYDNNGNTLSKTTGTDKVNYQWDAENRLIGVDNNGDGVNEITNQYDSDGIRISQTVNGEETRFLVDKNRDYAQVLEEYTPSKIIKASYVYGHDLISQLRNSQRSFYHVDGLGSTRALTDINGLVTDSYAYEAFGEMIKQLGNTQNLYLFAGEQRDPNLGLDYLRARYLDVNTGRFPSRDYFEGSFWIPETLHKYLYANANPILFIDPSGLFTLTELSLVQEIQGILRAGQAQVAAFGGRRIVLKAGCFIVEEIVDTVVTEGIYLFIDELKFVGRPYGGQSNEVNRRLKQHVGSRLKSVENVLARFNLKGADKATLTLLEQWVVDIITAETGGKVSNIRQPIGPKRQNLRKILDNIKLCK